GVRPHARAGARRRGRRQLPQQARPRGDHGARGIHRAAVRTAPRLAGPVARRRTRFRRSSVKPYSEHHTVPSLLEARARDDGDLRSVLFAGETVTFAELDDRADRVHRWLHEAGVRPGDRVAVFMRNSLEFLYGWMGITKAGAVAVPINTAMVGDALQY